MPRQCDARPKITFPATKHSPPNGWYQIILLGVSLSVNNLPRVALNNGVAGWLLTFDDIKVDVADEELVPLVGVTTRLVHPVLHLELHQPA